MKKFLIICCAVLLTFGLSSVILQKNYLADNILRMHILANSDTREDQQEKLLVRDAVAEYLRCNIENIRTKDEAEQFIYSRLPQLLDICNQTLAEAGSDHTCHIELCEMYYDTRTYETFRLPAGTYSSLQIKIGKAEGKNWWCVAFPSLCLAKTEEEFASVAVSSGFDPATVNTLKNDGYEVRFFLLDCIGKLEKFF